MDTKQKEYLDFLINRRVQDLQWEKKIPPQYGKFQVHRLAMIEAELEMAAQCKTLVANS